MPEITIDFKAKKNSLLLIRNIKISFYRRHVNLFHFFRFRLQVKISISSVGCWTAGKISYFVIQLKSGQTLLSCHSSTCCTL